MLKEVKEKFDRIAEVSAKTSKMTLLRKFADDELFLECLKFLLDSDVVTGLSTKKIDKKVPILSETFDDIRDVFKYLKYHNTGTDSDISVVKTFCLAQGECEEFCKELFTKKLKVGIDVKTVNKVYGKGFIREFNIMLGSKFDFDKPPKEIMYITEKYDGLRCFTIIENGKITIKSRQNKVFEGLVDIEDSIKALGLDNVCLDGELLSIGSAYEDVYKDTTKKVNNKNTEKHGVKYMLFDIIPLEEFNKGVGKTKYSKRREMLEKMIETNLYIDVAPVLYKGDNMDIVLQLLGKFRDRGAEGLMCSLDKPYEFKRSKTLLKMKVMQTCDLKVIGFEEGQGKFANTLGKVICDYKGYELGVGSGWSDDMRNEVWNNQDKYLGKIAEIQYFEETNNDTGGLSLRFPVFKTWRDDKNEESYN